MASTTTIKFNDRGINVPNFQYGTFEGEFEYDTQASCITEIMLRGADSDEHNVHHKWQMHLAKSNPLWNAFAKQLLVKHQSDICELAPDHTAYLPDDWPEMPDWLNPEFRKHMRTVADFSMREQISVAQASSSIHASNDGLLHYVAGNIAAAEAGNYQHCEDIRRWMLGQFAALKIGGAMPC